MKDIEGYNGKYKATEDGHIHAEPSNKRPKGCILKHWLIGKGYEMVMLYKDGVPKKFLVHRLIAITYVPNPHSLPEVNHIDGNRRNNKPENLEWVTSKENKQKAIAMGLYARLGKNPAIGEKSGASKLTDKQVTEIRQLHSKGHSAKSLGRKYKVSDIAIGCIVKRRTWKHIP